MPFTSYATIGDVARAHRVHINRREFVTPVVGPLSDSFRSELEFTLREVAFDNSGSIICETLIYPLLRDVWKPYREHLTLWSHQAIAFDDDLCGVPDYIVARRSPLGALVFDIPYLLVAEAKRDDFTRGWGQCLAAMLAAQRLNRLSDQTLYGDATNGRGWELGQLEGDIFTQDPRPFSLRNLDDLAGALHFLMTQCREQVNRQPVPA